VADLDDATPPRRIPVSILTGFLGAGKTSVLNHVLTESRGSRIAVVVNDFGSINIDAAVIDNRGGNVISLKNGCICCDLSEGLLMTVLRLLRRQDPPEHIVVETSGVSDPVKVARTFRGSEIQNFSSLECIVAVVDAERAPTLDGEMLQLARRQVAVADLAVLNKTDLVDDTGRRRALEWVQQCASHDVRVTEADHGRIPIELLLGVDVAREWPVTTATSPSAMSHPYFDTHTFDRFSPVPVARLHSMLAHLPPTVLRVKGIVNLAEKPGNSCVVQSTGKRAELTVGQPWRDRIPRTQIVFIGTRGGVDGDWIDAQLTQDATSSR